MGRQLARLEGAQDAVISYVRQLQYGFRKPIELSDSTDIQPYNYPHQVPAEVAKYFSSQHIGKVKIPFDLEQELERSCRQTGLKGRRLRQVAFDLTKKLRRMSRTLSRGGIQDKPSKLLEMKKYMKYKNPETNMVIYNLMKAGYTPSASQTVSQVARVATDFVDVTTKKHVNLAPEYKEQESLAYTAVRSPACYAAIYRVMNELRQRYPDFEPTRMMDFGCGPGTAVWAAQKVWGAAIDDVVAVDHADQMLTIGNTVEKRRSARGQWTPNIRWVMQIPGLTKNKYFPTVRRKYNLVVAAYVLGEVSNQYERDWLVRSLWSQCSDIMIIIEPGTPVGSRLVRDMRAMILREENKRAEKQSGSSKKGAHVVAPCPHDGPCPMDKNKHWWCHFNQRFERTLVQRICKIRPGGGKARDYQDERYSYIVLRRGPRSHVQDVSIDPQFVMDELEDIDYAVIPQKVVKKLEKSGKVMAVEEIFPNVRGEEIVEEDDELVAMNLLMQRMAVPAIAPSHDVNSNSDEIQQDQESFCVLRTGGNSELDLKNDQEIYNHANVNQNQNFQLDNGNVEQQNTQRIIPVSNNGSNFRSKYQILSTQQSMGAGLKTSYIQDLYDANNDENHDNDLILSKENLNNINKVGIENKTQLSQLNNKTQLSEKLKEGQDILEAEEDTDVEELSDFRWVDWHREDPESVAAAGTACSRWGRLLRPPIKEYRKVVMHVCSPQGVIQKRIITRLDSKKYWFGKAGYRMARKARWGDLWPSFYNRSDIVVELGKKSGLSEQNEDSLDGSQFAEEGEEKDEYTE